MKTSGEASWSRAVRGCHWTRVSGPVLGIEDGDYHVFLTPEGNSRGLFVSDRQPDGFDVREQDRGTSTLTFSHRVVAVRSGHKPERMAALVEEATLFDATRVS